MKNIFAIAIIVMASFISFNNAVAAELTHKQELQLIANELNDFVELCIISDNAGSPVDPSVIEKANKLLEALEILGITPNGSELPEMNLSDRRQSLSNAFIKWHSDALEIWQAINADSNPNIDILENQEQIVIALSDYSKFTL